MNPASNLLRTQTICAKIMKVIIDILCTEPIAGFLYRVTIFYTVKRSRHEYTHLFSMHLKLKTQNSKLKASAQPWPFFVWDNKCDKYRTGCHHSHGLSSIRAHNK